MKTLRGQLGEKDTVIAKAAERLKEVHTSIEKANADKAAAEGEKGHLQDEMEQVKSKLKGMETKLAAVQNMGGGGAAPVVDEAAEAAKLEAALAAAGDDEEAKAAAQAAHEEALQGEDPLQAIMAQIDAGQKELEKTQQELTDVRGTGRCGHPTTWTILQHDGPNHLGL